MKVSAEWIEYAHGPGAESEQPLAIAICDLIAFSTGRSVEVTDPVLIAEIKSVAELYAYDTNVQDQDNPLWWRAYPRRLIARCNAALKVRT